MNKFNAWILMAVLAGFGAESRAETEARYEYSGTQRVFRAMSADGASEGELVEQPRETRTYAFLYRYEGRRQLLEFTTEDTRVVQSSGQRLSRICNHYVNPLPLGTNTYIYDVLADVSCTGQVNFRPGRVIVTWQGGHTRKIAYMAWANMPAANNANFYANVYFQGWFDTELVIEIKMPNLDNTRLFEKRSAKMRLRRD